MSTRHVDGSLLREQGRAEVYLIRDGERLWIPNPYVLEALGLDWGAVQEVPAGDLDGVPRDDSWAGIGGMTPGSVVFVPSLTTGIFGLTGRVYWPVPLATSKRHVAWGQEVRTVELRGWISPPGGPNASDPDFSYELEVDVGWVLDRGIDLGALIRVGNILGIGAGDPAATNPRAWCATPRIKLEISGFPPKGQRGRKPPPDWTTTTGVTLDDAGAAANGQLVLWPFDPAKPAPSNVDIAGGEYVRVFGSIVSDKAHPDTADMAAIRDGVVLWLSSNGNSEGDEARWTEIHPPDWIEVLRPAETPPQTFRGVAVAAPGTYPWRAPVESTLDVDILAPPRPDADAILRYREFVGPETATATIVDGNAAGTGALITPLPAGDGIHVHVTVAGARSFTGGGPGRFRALYWLYWERAGRTPAAAEPSIALLLLDEHPGAGSGPSTALLLGA